MKNNNLLKGLSAAAVLAVVGVGAIALGAAPNIQAKALDANQYYHYKGLAATCEQDGVSDYYTNCYDTTLTELPAGATVVEERQATAETVAAIKAANPEDSRLIEAKRHNFNATTGVCEHTVDGTMTTEALDVYSGHATKGSATLTATTNEAEGCDTIYEYAHKNTSGSASYFITPFTDLDISDYTTLWFYINTNGSALFIAGDDETTATSYQMASGDNWGTEGYIIATNKGNGTWNLHSEDFKFRRMKDGGPVTDFELNNRTTLSKLIYNFQTWGANKILISEIHYEKNEMCGARNYLGDAILNPTKWTKTTASDATTGDLYNASGNIKYQTGDFYLDGLTELRFRVKNNDTVNGFIVKGNFSNALGCIYSGKDETVVAAKTPTGWSVSLASGHKMFQLPSSAEVESYSVEGASKFSDLFYFETASSDIEISDFVAKGEPTVKRYNITDQAMNVYENDATLGTATLTPTGESVLGFGQTYLYKSTYNDLTTKKPIVSLFKEYDLTDVKAVEFYITMTETDNGTLLFVDDEGKETYMLHPNAGGVGPGIIRAVQQETAGTWNITGTDIAIYHSGSQLHNFTFTGRTNLRQLFTSAGGWGVTSITVGDIIAYK